MLISRFSLLPEDVLHIILSYMETPPILSKYLQSMHPKNTKYTLSAYCDSLLVKKNPTLLRYFYLRNNHLKKSKLTWVRRFDSDTGESYWFNTTTKLATWTEPPLLKKQLPPPASYCQIIKVKNFCRGQTLNNSPCRRVAKSGHYYCHHHNLNNPLLTKPIFNPPVNTLINYFNKD